MTVEEVEPAKETEKPWPETEVENQEKVVSWRPMKEIILGWKKRALKGYKMLLRDSTGLKVTFRCSNR